jgi:hypothetical protein
LSQNLALLILADLITGYSDSKNEGLVHKFSLLRHTTEGGEAYETRKGKKKMMAAYNLAVYYEAHDDTERALEYLDEAISMVKSDSYDAGMMKVYRMQLSSRIEKRKQLDVQMKRFK